MTLSIVFCALLLAGLAVRLWLASRQARHVWRHREQVPAAFAGTLPAEAHRKAAAYTIAKLRFGILEAALEAALLLGWTLLGGLDALNQALLAWLGPGMLQQLVLLNMPLIGDFIADVVFLVQQQLQAR